MFVHCTSAGGEREAVAPTSGERVFFEAGGPLNGVACRVESRRRGCRSMPFQGTCAAYFSAGSHELARIRATQYLNLRFRGDAFLDRAEPPLVPWDANRAFIGASLTLREITALADLVGGIESPGLDWGSEHVGRIVAFSNSFVGRAYEVAPETLRVLANIRDLHRVAVDWDRSSRQTGDSIEFGPDAVSECADLLSHIVAVARDAAENGRGMYVVQSLPAYREPCAGLGGCAGLGCDYDSEGTNVCHSKSDECQQYLDCSPGEGCVFETAAAKWLCRSGPN
jgi:hypothetical protein